MKNLWKKIPLSLILIFTLILCVNIRVRAADDATTDNGTSYHDFQLATDQLTIYNDKLSEHTWDYNVTKTVAISGLSSTELSDLRMDETSSNSYLDIECYIKDSNLVIESYGGSGSVTLNLVFGNITKTLHINCYEVYLSGGDSFYLQKGKTKQLSVKGYSGKVSWKTTSKSVASVTSSGKVKAGKEGNAIVYAVLPDGTKVGCLVMSVSSARLKIIKRAKYIATHWKYSQAKRLKNGYFDCSSLVWKSYKAGGKKLAGKSYAMTAADLGKWMVSHKKTLKGSVSGNLAKMKYKPGALCFETGAKNGRYKGIYHVEMLTGYTFCGFQNNNVSKPVVYPTFARNYSPGTIIAQPF